MSNIGSLGRNFAGYGYLGHLAATGNLLIDPKNPVIADKVVNAGWNLTGIHPGMIIGSQIKQGLHGALAGISNTAADTASGISQLAHPTMLQTIGGGVASATQMLTDTFGPMGAVFAGLYLSNKAGGFLNKMMSTNTRNSGLLSRAYSLSNKLTSATQIEKEMSKTLEDTPTITALMRADRTDQSAGYHIAVISYLAAIEANTSPISRMVASKENWEHITKANKISTQNAIVNNLNELGSGNLRAGADQRGWLQKTTRAFEEFTLKAKMYDPVTFLSTILNGLSPTKLMKDLKDQNLMYNYAIKSAKRFGINTDQTKLLYTPSGQIIKMGGENPELALMSGQYELLRLIAQESVTIRKTMGAEENMTLHDQLVDDRSSLTDMLDNFLGFIPGYMQIAKPGAKLFDMLLNPFDYVEKIKPKFNSFMAKQSELASDTLKYFTDPETFKKEFNSVMGSKIEGFQGILSGQEIKNKTLYEHIPNMMQEMLQYLHGIYEATSGTEDIIARISGQSKIEKTIRNRQIINPYTGQLQTKREFDDFSKSFRKNIVSFLGHKEDIRGTFDGLIQTPKNWLFQLLNKTGAVKTNEYIMNKLETDKEFQKEYGASGLFAHLKQFDNLSDVNGDDTAKKSNKSWTWGNSEKGNTNYGRRGYYDDDDAKKYLMNMTQDSFFKRLNDTFFAADGSPKMGVTDVDAEGGDSIWAWFGKGKKDPMEKPGLLKRGTGKLSGLLKNVFSKLPNVLKPVLTGLLTVTADLWLPAIAIGLAGYLVYQGVSSLIDWAHGDTGKQERENNSNQVETKDYIANANQNDMSFKQLDTLNRVRAKHHLKPIIPYDPIKQKEYMHHWDSINHSPIVPPSTTKNIAKEISQKTTEVKEKLETDKIKHLTEHLDKVSKKIEEIVATNGSIAEIQAGAAGALHSASNNIETAITANKSYDIAKMFPHVSEITSLYSSNQYKHILGTVPIS